MSTLEDIRGAILGRNSLIYLQTWEEERAVKILEGFAQKLFKGESPVTVWTCVGGLRGHVEAPEATDPVAAIRAALGRPGRGFFLFKDLAEHMDRPDVVRALRDAYRELGSERFFFLISPRVEMPSTLEKEVYLVEMGLPGEKELLQLTTGLGRSYGQDPLHPELASELPVALKGLTTNEARHALHRVFRTAGTAGDKLRQVFLEKAHIVRKSGLLEFVPPEARLDDIGGLDNLKDWLVRRQRLFTREALGADIPVPKGMLVMGVSGCGKSFAAKAVSALWKVPLYRLDMSLVFSGAFGSPETAFHKALRTIESLAPGILWIDEIENSLGMDDAGRGDSVNSQIFSAFLTWMQEKPPLIFVAATANRIEALPAEVIRKGRFDQIYFVDLPSDEERLKIFEIHLKRHGADLSNIDFDVLRVSTQGWNGAEIEQAVKAARVDAYDDGRPLGMDHLTANTASIVPLSKTMAEQIKKIRAWAVRRATPASSHSRLA
ncbi:MAG: AAA family ATPase [Acidobacteriota bacterium]